MRLSSQATGRRTAFPLRTKNCQQTKNDYLTGKAPYRFESTAIGGEPDPLDLAQRLPNGFELSGFVAALGRASAVEAFGPQKDWCPALPGRHNILWFEQVE